MLKTIISIMIVFFLNTISLTNAQINEELIQLSSLTPEIEKGKKVFNSCAKCHGIEGWGSSNGDFPQLAGQHKSVVIKQLLDIRSGKRINPIMRPVIFELSRQGEQAIANVAAYIETLKMDPEPEIGEADDDVIEKTAVIYEKQCASCHGASGEGIASKFYPLLQGQNYYYLFRQLKHIQSGKRKNSNREMQKIISQMSLSELDYLADFISRLEPEENKIAPFD